MFSWCVKWGVTYVSYIQTCAISNDYLVWSWIRICKSELLKVLSDVVRCTSIHNLTVIVLWWLIGSNISLWTIWILFGRILLDFVAYLGCVAWFLTVLTNNLFVCVLNYRGRGVIGRSLGLILTSIARSDWSMSSGNRLSNLHWIITMQNGLKVHEFIM